MTEEQTDAKLTTICVLCEVEKERVRQDAKWGEQNHGVYKWLAILGEEVGEANKSALEGNAPNYRDELIQIAAVAVAMIECHDRNLAKADT